MGSTTISPQHRWKALRLRFDFCVDTKGATYNATREKAVCGLHRLAVVTIKGGVLFSWLCNCLQFDDEPRLKPRIHI